jgi:hypothetical protein
VWPCPAFRHRPPRGYPPLDGALGSEFKVVTVGFFQVNEMIARLYADRMGVVVDIGPAVLVRVLGLFNYFENPAGRASFAHVWHEKEFIVHALCGAFTFGTRFQEPSLGGFGALTYRSGFAKERKVNKLLLYSAAFERRRRRSRMNSITRRSISSRISR